MNKLDKVLAGLFVLNAVSTVVLIDKERPKITPPIAAAVVAIDVALAAAFWKRSVS